jgi:5-methylcytosine-specific restriction enzyme A
MPRGKAYPRISYRDPDWLRRRAIHLKRFPWCRYCQQQGRNVKATHVDHILPHRGNAALFEDDSNLQSLCRICANTVKQVEEITGGELGCDLLGNPRSASHPWSGGSPDPPKYTSQTIGRMLRERKQKDD